MVLSGCPLLSGLKFYMDNRLSVHVRIPLRGTDKKTKEFGMGVLTVCCRTRGAGRKEKLCLEPLNKKAKDKETLPNSGDFCGDLAQIFKGAKLGQSPSQVGETTQFTEEFFGNLGTLDEAREKAKVQELRAPEARYSQEELAASVDVLKLLIKVRNRCRENGHIEW